MFSNTNKDINFLEAYSFKGKRNGVDARVFITILIVELALLAGTSGFMFGSKKLTEIENTTLTSQIQELSHVEKRMAEVKSEGILLKSKQGIKDAAININNVTYNTLTIFEEVLTSDMSIENMTIDMKSLNFIVKGAKEDNFAQLMHNMESSGLFSKVTISAISSKEEDGFRRASVNAEIVRK
ncbi:MAG: hypothetical protein RR539_09705 [Clostridium sp.]|uniref:PilN domain-containing protein n=1 Tax=Clostridium sp. TaxID=1506 RepID=UPI002FCAFF08